MPLYIFTFYVHNDIFDNNIFVALNMIAENLVSVFSGSVVCVLRLCVCVCVRACVRVCIRYIILNLSTHMRRRENLTTSEFINART